MTSRKYREQSSETMTRSKLLRIIRKLPEHQPIACSIPPPSSYDSHKDHWIGWLSHYNGPGYYGRKYHDRSCQYVWNHLQCGPMLVWLAEAVSVDKRLVRTAALHCKTQGVREAAICGAIRKCLPWSVVLKALEALPRG